MANQNSGLNRPQNLGANYDSLLDANPYVGSLNQRKRTPWEEFQQMLGFRSAFDRDVDMLTAQANEYYAQIAQQAYAENYNSPAAQAERERSAGINPDIAGNVTPGEAQTPGQDASVPDFSANDSLNEFTDIITAGFTLATGLSSSIVDIMGRTNQLRYASQANDVGIVGLARDLVTNLGTTPDDMQNNVEWTNQLPNYLADTYGIHMSKREKTLFTRSIKNALSSMSAQTSLFEQSSDLFDARKKAKMKKGSCYSPTQNEDEVLDILTRNLQEINDDTELYAAKNARDYQEKFNASAAAGAENAQNKYTGDFYDSSDGKAAGRAGNASALLGAQTDRVQYRLREGMENIINDLDKAARHGNQLAKYLKFAYSLKELQMTSAFGREKKHGGSAAALATLAKVLPK